MILPFAESPSTLSWLVEIKKRVNCLSCIEGKWGMKDIWCVS